MEMIILKENEVVALTQSNILEENLIGNSLLIYSFLDLFNPLDLMIIH